MRVASLSPTAGGWLVDVEIPQAYTDGSARTERVFVTAEDMRGTREEKLQAIKDALINPGIRGEDLDAPITQTKAVYERRAVTLFETWQRWKATRVEAEVRAAPALIVTALTTREDVAWTDYVALLATWRTAP